MYFLLLIVLVLASFLIFNTLVSFLATFLWHGLHFLLSKQSAFRQAQMIFALRVLPFGGALLFTTLLLLPAYFLFEPQSSGEVVSIKLVIVALVSAIGLLSAGYRVLLTWNATRRLVQNWLRDAVQIEISNVHIPVYCVQHSFPLIAVVGVIRPRMFIAQHIFTALEPAEIQAAILHEQGHLVSRDNLKRALLRFCRDLLLIPDWFRLESAWAEKTELAADEFAARIGGQATTLNLAAALIKIARIVPHAALSEMPIGAFLIAEQTCDITERVRNLVQLTEVKDFTDNHRSSRVKINSWIYLSGILGSLLFLIIYLGTNYNLFFNIHEVLEFAVKILQ